MIEWEATAGGFRVFDSDNSQLAVSGSELTFYRADQEIPRPVDITLDCAASELSFPAAVVYAISLESGQTHELGSDTEPLSLQNEEYLIDLDTEIKSYLRFEGPAALRRSEDFDQVTLSLPARQRITVGFRSRHRRPADTLTVPPTPDGFATALTHLPAAHKTTGPERSYPTLRGHPPLVELDDQTSIPDAFTEAIPDNGIRLEVPRSIEQLFVLSPLSYYLGAKVQVSEHDAPRLRAPAIGLDHEFPTLPELETDTARLLRKVFFLDCLVRNAGPYGTTLAEASLLDALGLDTTELYRSEPAQRLASYLDISYGAIEQRLPDWHLATYVDPQPERMETLPFLLDTLSLVYQPRTSELEGNELVERSLDDFYRGAGGHNAGQVASVDIVKPELRSGRIHSWLAEGTPIDVFKCVPAAFENRLDYLGREGDTIEIAVVMNDQDMRDEHADVAEIYRARSEDIPINVEVYDRLSCAELGRIFESELDFVHYIGHCEEHGLRCPDGYLSASSLDECNAQTFFLNACGSYHEGVELIEQGSVAGAITFSQVLNDHAIKVGSAFARLLVHGFGFERALQLARRRIMMGKDYAVVGDGTHTLAQNGNRLPATVTLEEIEGQYLISYDQFSTRHTGSFYRPYIGDATYAYLCGNESEFVVDKPELLTFLRRADSPVIYDGDVYWSEDLVEQLEDGVDGQLE
jgi:hypothetical protein